MLIRRQKRSFNFTLTNTFWWGFIIHCISTLSSVFDGGGGLHTLNLDSGAIEVYTLVICPLNCIILGQIETHHVRCMELKKKNTYKIDVVSMTLIWWQGSSSGDLRCVDNSFLAITARSILTQSGNNSQDSIYGGNKSVGK